MDRWIGAVGALLMLLLAGCVSDAPEAVAPESAEPEAVDEGPIRDLPGADAAFLFHHGCRVYGADIPWPVELMRSALPDGFALTPWNGDPAGGLGVVRIITHACVTGEGKPVAEHYELYLVEPPAELRNPAAQSHALVTWAVLDNGEHAGAMTAWGVDVRGGSVDVQTTPLAAGAIAEVLADAGTSSTDFQAVAVGPEAPRPPAMTRLFGFDFAGGLAVTGIVDVLFGESQTLGTGPASYQVQTAGLVVYAGAGTGWHAGADDASIVYSVVPFP